MSGDREVDLTSFLQTENVSLNRFIDLYYRSIILKLIIVNVVIIICNKLFFVILERRRKRFWRWTSKHMRLLSLIQNYRNTVK